MRKETINKGNGEDRTTKTQTEKETEIEYKFRENSDDRWWRAVLIFLTYGFVLLMMMWAKGC